MTPVSNAGPLIALAKVGRIELLRLVFGRLHIPLAVYDEVATRGAGKADAAELQQATEEWVEKHVVPDEALVRGLLTKLGAGEAEAIALAVEMDADLLLMDDNQARTVAEFIGLNVIGTVGVLVEATRRGLIGDLAQTLHELRAAGVRMSDSVIEAATRAAHQG